LKGMFTTDEFSLFLCFYVSFLSQTSSLQLFSACCCCCRGGWVLCCWKHWIDLEGLWLLWVCCAGTWQALIICGQHIRQHTHAVQGSFKDSFKFPPFFPSHKHDAIIVLFLGFRKLLLCTRQWHGLSFCFCWLYLYI
jgi:hypothetical protein